MNKNSKKRSIILSCILAGIVLVGAAIWTHRTLCPSKQQALDALVRIEAYSQYELRQNGKLILAFDKDTTILSACFTNQWALVPSCQGRMVVAYNNQLNQDKFQGQDADSIYQNCVDSIDSMYKDAKWKEKELTYYINSHSVQDFGFNRICAFANQEQNLKNTTKKMLDSLKHAQGNGHFELKHHVDYRAFYTSSLHKTTSEKCHLVKLLEGTHTFGLHLFQLNSQKTPDNISALSPRIASELARAHSACIRKSICYEQTPDSLGCYTGCYNEAYLPHGHGIWQGYDGTYYEGNWKEGKREGFGFSIAPKKPLRVGEWKNDKYKGERLVYNAERIYGIDISKYQHQQGKKRYAINWSKLRITHLGSLSKKTVSGNVDFPIRFIYIKSTEGSSLLNPYYKKDYSDARAHGYHVGSYHFFSINTPASKQAQYFLKYSHIGKADLPPVLDLEPLPSQIKKIGGANILFARVRTWLRAVERATGKKPILYISQQFVNRYLPMAPDLKRNYNVWIARYGEYKPDIHLVLWQLCPDGRVAGIHGHVDINVFNGYSESFTKFSQNEIVK